MIESLNFAAKNDVWDVDEVGGGGYLKLVTEVSFY